MFKENTSEGEGKETFCSVTAFFLFLAWGNPSLESLFRQNLDSLIFGFVSLNIVYINDKHGIQTIRR